MGIPHIDDHGIAGGSINPFHNPFDNTNVDPRTGVVTTTTQGPGVGNSSTTTSDGPVTETHSRGCFSENTSIDVDLGQAGDHNVQIHDNHDGTTTVTVDGREYTAPTANVHIHEGGPWSPTATTHSTTTTRHDPISGQTTSTETIGHSTITTTEQGVPHNPITGEPRYPLPDNLSAPQITVTVGQGDSVDIQHNADGSTDVTIDGVEHHYAPGQDVQVEVARTSLPPLFGHIPPGILRALG